MWNCWCICLYVSKNYVVTFLNTRWPYLTILCSRKKYNNSGLYFYLKNISQHQHHEGPMSSFLILQGSQNRFFDHRVCVTQKDMVCFLMLMLGLFVNTDQWLMGFQLQLRCAIAWIHYRRLPEWFMILESESMNCLSINIWGACGGDKRSWIRGLCNMYWVSCLHIQETKMTSMDGMIVRSFWGNQTFEFVVSMLGVSLEVFFWCGIPTYLPKRGLLLLSSLWP